MNLPVKIFLNRLRIDRIMVMSLWPRFLAHTVGRSSPSCWEGPSDFLFSVSSDARRAEARGSKDRQGVVLGRGKLAAQVQDPKRGPGQSHGQ